MLKMKNTLSIFVLFLVSVAAPFVHAQPDPCPPGNNYVDWLNCKVDNYVSLAVEQRGTNKQVQTPSISDSSTSLIDQTEAPDLVGLALNFAGLSNKSDDDSKGVTSFTTSLYALSAAMGQTDPLDPVFYKKKRNLRRFSLTFGREDASDANNNQASTIAGFKVLLLNYRDLGRNNNIKLISDLMVGGGKASQDFANTSREFVRILCQKLEPAKCTPTPTPFIRDHLSTNFAATYARLTKEEKEEVDQLIKKRLTAETILAEETQRVMETIRRKPQLSFSFQSKLREKNGADEYRAGLLYDFGLVNRLNFAVNTTFDYKDAKVIGGDTRGGRIAAEGYYRLNSDRKLLFTGKDPILLSFGGEGKWMSGKGPTYQGQARLTFPLFDGVSLPLSVTWANRKDLIKESTVRGNFGITFDLAKALKGFKK